MGNVLSTGVSGLRAFQRALDVTSHNIANVSTPGYSRQRVELGTREPERLGNSYAGTGVDVNLVDRVYDEMLTGQMRNAASTMARLETYAGKAQALNNLFSDTTTGLPASMQRFMNSVQGVATAPTSTAARQVMLSEAEGLRQRLQTYDRRLTDLNTEVNQRITAETAAISTAAEGIARLNEQISTAAATVGGPPNDLLDARDRLITELSDHLNVSITKQDNGAWNVFVGNGQSLVLGSRASKIVAQQDGFNPDRLVVAFQTGANTVDLSSSLSGGSLGGLLDARRELIDPARNQLGQIAAGMASVVNSQHREGMDLYGNLGGDLFALGAVDVQPNRANTGGASLNVARVDAGALTATDYVLDYNGSAWSMRRSDNGAAVALTGAGTPASPLVADGISIVVSGAAAAGDKFQIRPTATAAQGMSVLITDPSKVAAAAPIRSSAASANSGKAGISAGEVLDAANPALRNTTTLAFTSPTTYSVNGAGSFTYTPGANIDINGWRVQLSGTAATGDVFTVQSNVGGVGDNRNALALSDVLSAGVLAGGTESVNGAITRFVGGIGVATNQAKTGAETQQLILDEVRTEIDSVSGVNLDEEAANMVRYQQAYQAAAQVIRITQDMFDTLLRATQR